MKRSILVLIIAMLAFAGSALAQAPERGQGQGRGGGGGGGRGRGGPAPAPALTGPLADMVNAIITALNTQDAAYFQKNVAPDAIWLDEDGHMLPATLWIGRLMQAKPAK